MGVVILPSLSHFKDRDDVPQFVGRYRQSSDSLLSGLWFGLTGPNIPLISEPGHVRAWGRRVTGTSHCGTTLIALDLGAPETLAGPGAGVPRENASYFSNM